jgi:Transposase DDE domain
VIKKDKKRKKKKQKYRIRNWKDYNKALANRGSMTLWFDDDSIQSWLNHSKSGNPGRPRKYADACILCMLVLKSVYHLPQRATYGLVCSLMQLMELDLPVPHPTILSRRASSLDVVLPRVKKNEPLHVLVDATGLKVFGEGEWKVRTHGVGKRRTWRKLHIAMDADTGEILATVATTSYVSDKEVLPNLLEQITDEIKQVGGDGGYDYADCYEEIAKRSARALIPPRRTGRLHPKDERLRERDKNLREIRKVGRKKWKRESGYHRRSLVETTMMRVKTIYGSGLSSRRFHNQATEMSVRCAALNRMTGLGMPDSYAI